MRFHRPMLRHLAIAFALVAFAMLAPVAARATRVDYPTGTGPTGLVVADLDGDGKLDVVTANTQAATVSVLKGVDGGLAGKVDYATGNGPAAVVALDLDADGHPDLVVANSWGRTVSILHNLGNGTFAEHVDVDAGGAPTSLATGDWDGDGHVDVAATVQSRAVVALLFGDGAGALGRRRFADAYSTALNGIAAGDLDGDGNSDLVVADGGAGSIAVLGGDGTGDFYFSGSYSTGGTPQGIALVDVDHDGDLDAVVCVSGIGEVAYLAGDHAGGFAAPVLSDAGTSPQQIVTGDFDLDGALDALVSNPGAGQVSLVFGNGTGHFPDRRVISAGSGAWGIGVGSFAGVSGVSLVSANSGANTVSLLSSVFNRNAVLTFTVSPNPAGTQQLVTLSVVMSPPTATGTVTLRDGGALLGTHTLVLGAVQAAYAFTQGNHYLVAQYNGDANFPPVTSSPVTLFVRAGTPTSLTFIATPTTIVYGGAVTLNATMVPANASGAVGFYDGGSVVAQGVLSNGHATGNIAAGVLNAGVHRLVAGYAGDGNFLPSASDTLFYTVDRDSSRTTMVGPSQSISAGAVFSVDVSVRSVHSPGLPVSGTIQLEVDGVATNYAGVLSGSAVRISGISLAVGDHVLRAVYSGSTNLFGSVSPPIAIHSGPDLTTTTLFAYPTIGRLNEVRDFSAAVASLANANAVPSGSVQFVLDGTDWGAPVALVNRQASFRGGADLDVGAHTIGARYLGSVAAMPSTATDVGITVSPGLTRTAIAGTASPTSVTAPKTFTATVTSEYPSIYDVTGIVQFQLDGAPLLSPVPLVDGVATLADVTTIPAGVHTIRASYLGSTRFGGSASGSLVHRVVPASLPVIVSVLDLPADQGRQVRLTVRASTLDVAGIATPVQAYGVYRRVDAGASAAQARPDGAALAGWDQVGTFDARAETLYTAVVPTLRDSNAAGTHWATYMVSARTSTPSVFFDSAPDSGYSVDNFPPASPAPFSARIESGAAHLHWGANHEPDFALYRLYRGSGDHVAPSGATLVAQQPDTGFVDPAPGEGAAYALTAVDQNGNESVAAQLGAAQIPVLGPPLALAIALRGANPITGAVLALDVTVASAAPARVELYEVGGRRVLARDLGTLPAGRHTVELTGGQPLRAGLYFVQLVQGSERRRERICVLR